MIDRQRDDAQAAVQNEAQKADRQKRAQFVGGRGGAAKLPARARRTARLRRGMR